MKKIRKYHCNKTLLSLIFSILATTATIGYTRSLLMGTIQFPPAIKQIPAIRVYYGGKIISSNIHESGMPKVTFEVTRGKRQNRFYILVIETFDYQLKQTLESDWNQNTIDYLKITPDQPYKFYVLDLIQDTPELDQNNSMEILKHHTQNYPSTYHWEINDGELSQEGKVPDATIIVRYFPELIQGLKGGNNLELPTIVLRPDMVEHYGSEEKLYEDSIKLLLASIDSDTIHAPTKREIKSDHRRVLVVYSMT